MRSTVTFITLATLALPLTAGAQPGSDVDDLVGARAAGGESQLLARGYESRTSNVSGATRRVFWWNARAGRCIAVSTTGGRYSNVTMVPADNCMREAEAGRFVPRIDDEDEGYGGIQPVFHDRNSLMLVCHGTGSQPMLSNQTSSRWNKKEKKWEWSNNLVSTQQSFDSDARIELSGNRGRIYLGRKIGGRKHDEGRDLFDLVVSSGTITARYRLSGLDKPKLNIDRRSGLIKIKGDVTFSGQCEEGEQNGGRRF